MSLKDIDQNKLSIAVNSALNILSIGTTAIGVAKDIATATVNFYTAFTQNSGISGSDKKSIVLSLLEQTWNEFIKSPDSFSEWALKISNFIDAIHSAYTSLIDNVNTIRNILFGVNNGIQNTNPTAS